MENQNSDYGIYVGYAIAIIIVVVIGVGAIAMMVSTDQRISTTIDLKTVTEQSEKYQGWDMPCNYVEGHDGEWNEEKGEYGDQRYLDCANGIIYEAIGKSPSVVYFNPNDKELNKKYCKMGWVALFNYPNPITKTEGDQFQRCIRW